ncbi:MAG: hypothetical protein FJX45_05285 [Alphaproteobacteria bacterium]|nr:hypothetical protein [Alphaproteobacteria bacterium]MBM3653661.1 hypothetical protein [Alphaproteobacteria bacterium]
MGNQLETKFAAASSKSRRLLVDAAVCFVATSLVAFLPPQWKNGEALREIVFTTDPVSGKIIDRILSEGTGEDSAARDSGAPAPAVFAVFPQERIADWSTKAAAEKIEAAPVKATKLAALRKAPPEKKNPVEATPPAPPSDRPAPAAAQTMGENSDQEDRGWLARLDPRGLPSKLAPLGQKAWNGATSLTSAVSSVVNAYRF